MSPYRITERFAPLTRSVSDLLRQVTPAANDLWAYLRQQHRPDVPFIVRLKEVAIELGYSTKWLRNALDELVSLELIQKLEQWWGQTYRLMLQPLELNQETPEPDKGNSNKNGDLGQKTSNSQASNPHSSVPTNRDLVEIKHGVSVSFNRGNWYKEKTAESGPNQQATAESIAPPQPESVAVAGNEALYQKAAQVAPGFSPKVFIDALARFGSTRILNAISATAEQIATGKTNDPAAFLNVAIRKGFTANGQKRKGRSPAAATAEPPTLTEAWHLPGTKQVYVAPDDVRSRLQEQVEKSEREFRQGVKPPASVGSPVGSVATSDVSEELALIPVYIAQKRMNKEQVQALLEKRYQVQAQWKLSEDQLKDWFNFLQSPDCQPGTA